ncbi:MAG: DUF1343 domain-containing protein, partial [Candidatus Aminicenantes bacterium]|nr:DUF1343 domain-containing protein [Candidatus Aminicenantes bacterium]
DRHQYRSFDTSLFIIKTIMELYPESFTFHDEYFDKIMGTSRVREALKRGVGVKDIIESYTEELNSFLKLRQSHLLY